MEKQTKILLGIATIGVVGFALWRNYGVKSTNSIILNTPLGSSSDTTNEQKELIQKIKDTGTPSEGEILVTSFGKNKFLNGVWTKYAEVWGDFSDDKNKPTCPNGYKYVKYPIIKGFKEHLADKNGGKCVENNLDISIASNITKPPPMI